MSSTSRVNADHRAGPPFDLVKWHNNRQTYYPTYEVLLTDAGRAQGVEHCSGSQIMDA